MKKLIPRLLLLILVVSACKTSQQVVSTETQTPKLADSTFQGDAGSGDPVYELVDQNPQFPGGLDSLASFLRVNIIYPAKDRNEGNEGTSYVEFVVRKTGEVTDVRIFPPAGKNATPAMHFESIRVVNLMPDWIPGMQDGQLVSCRFLLPIKYTLK